MVPVGSSGSTHETMSVSLDFVSAAKFRTTDVCVFVRVCVCVSACACEEIVITHVIYTQVKVICLVLQPI